MSLKGFPADADDARSAVPSAAVGSKARKRDSGFKRIAG